MPPQNPVWQPLIAQVIANDLCIACGACIPACPYANVRPVFHVRRGAHEVEIVDPTRCDGCARPCDTVCPSIEVDFLRNRKAVARAEDTVSEPPRRDGWFEGIHLGWSPRFVGDTTSSSGGVIRAFIAHALEHGTEVICLARDPDGADFKPRLLTRTEDLERVPGSIYHSTSFVGAIDLLRQARGPVLLVAIPCQLSGILNHIAITEPRLRERIGLICGIVCGWMYSHHALHAFTSFKRLPPEDLKLTTYRGGDRVGKLKIGPPRARSAFSRREFSSVREMIDFRSCFSTDFNRLRCRVCEDHLNLGADVIAGDAWLKRAGTRKISVIGSRTHQGTEAIAELERAGYLRLERATFADFDESQSTNLCYGIEARRIAFELNRRGERAPVYRFHADDPIPTMRLRTALAFCLERFHRWLIRSGRYRLYRSVYIVRRWRLVWRQLRLRDGSRHTS